MDATKIARELLAYLANEGIELSEEIGQAETLLREHVLSIGGKALELHLGRYKLGYEGSTRSCPCGRGQRFVGNRPKLLATLLGTVTIKRAYYHYGACGASCLPYDEGVGLGRGQVSVEFGKAAGDPSFAPSAKGGGRTLIVQ